MGLHPQPNDWTCGPFALKHALLALGRMVDGERIARQTGNHWWSGVDEIRLARAARANECDLEPGHTRSADRARRALNARLKQRVPVLLCVDDWGHWITVVRVERSGYVVIDSQLDPVLNIVTWKQLDRRWRYLDRDYDTDDPPAIYDMYAVVPRFRADLTADFSAARVRFLRRPENRNLATHWNTYLEDMLSICRPPSNRSAERLSMAEFLRRHQDMILSRVVYWHGDVERSALIKLVRNFRFVAETYGLVVLAASAKQAIADVAILAAMWAAATRGVGDMYGTGAR